MNRVPDTSVSAVCRDCDRRLAGLVGEGHPRIGRDVVGERGIH